MSISPRVPAQTIYGLVVRMVMVGVNLDTNIKQSLVSLGSTLQQQEEQGRWGVCLHVPTAAVVGCRGVGIKIPLSQIFRQAFMMG